MDFFALIRYNSFQNYNNKKHAQSFAPSPLICKLRQEVWRFNDICVGWSFPQTDLETNFLNLENRSFEFLVTFKQIFGILLPIILFISVTELKNILKKLH